MDRIHNETPAPETEWKPLSSEERTRHEILFYNQGPMDGFLPGEHARELFLRSKLPLHVLSQIWNLVDQPQDNVLDTAEFAAAMHLLQMTLRGVPLPKETLPRILLPSRPRPEIRVPMMTKREMSAYRKLFEVLDQDKKGHLKAICVRDVLKTSGLSAANLAQIWDLSDFDRDGQLAVDEFCIACHLTRHTKKGRIHLNGPINVFSILPHRMLKTDLAAKKLKMTELEDLKKKLMAIRVKKKAEATKESERAQIWKERLEILRRRHQALRDDTVDGSEVILTRDNSKLDRVKDIVQRTEENSKRLDKEQQAVRKETAKVIMEAEKLSQDVKHLQEEVDKLRENRRRTSQLKDLDPFHQLFEDQKEASLTGIPVPQRKYDIHIPFKDDPFNVRKLGTPPLSGDELFNPAAENPSDILTKSSPWGSTSNCDPWLPTTSCSNLQDLTFGFEDNFVDTWGHSGLRQHDKNSNLVPDSLHSSSVIQEVVPSPISMNWESPEEEENPVFKTISVMEEEDDLWSSLPPSVLATQQDTMKYLQAKWAVTTERLRVLDETLQKQGIHQQQDTPQEDTLQKQGTQEQEIVAPRQTDLQIESLRQQDIHQHGSTHQRPVTLLLNGSLQKYGSLHEDEHPQKGAPVIQIDSLRQQRSRMRGSIDRTEKTTPQPSHILSNSDSLDLPPSHPPPPVPGEPLILETLICPPPPPLETHNLTAAEHSATEPDVPYVTAPVLTPQETCYHLPDNRKTPAIPDLELSTPFRPKSDLVADEPLVVGIKGQGQDITKSDTLIAVKQDREQYKSSPSSGTHVEASHPSKRQDFTDNLNDSIVQVHRVTDFSQTVADSTKSGVTDRNQFDSPSKQRDHDHWRQDSLSHSSSESPQPPNRRKKSFRKNSSGSSRDSTPLPSCSPSPQPPPRSRSTKRRSFQRRPPSLESQSSVQSFVGSRKLDFENESLSDASQKIEQDYAASSSNKLTTDSSSDILTDTDKGKSDTNKTGSTVVLRKKQKAPEPPDVSGAPPKPPPRLKKKLKLNRASQAYPTLDVTEFVKAKESIARSHSLPQGDEGIYENFSFPPVTVENPRFETDQSSFDDIEHKVKQTQHETVENVSVIEIKSVTTDCSSDDILETEKSSAPEVPEALDIDIPNNPENVQDGNDSSNQYVNVIQVSADEAEDEDNMDSHGRKQDLEALRAQFFGKKSQAVETTPALDTNITTSTTVISISGGPGPDPYRENTTVTSVIDDVPSPADPPAASLFEIIRKQKDSNSNNTSPQQTSPQPLASSNIFLDLNQPKVKHDIQLDPAAPKVNLNTLPSFKASSDFIPDDQPSHFNSEYTFINNNNKLPEDHGIYSGSSNARIQSSMAIDLEPVQVEPLKNTISSQTQALDQDFLIDTSVPEEFQDPIPVTNIDDFSELSSPETPVSPETSWRRAEESDMSEGEDNFLAMFTPGEPTLPEMRHGGDHEDDFEEDSGIVLVSYQQKRASSDFQEYEPENQLNEDRSQNYALDRSQSLEFDPYSPLAENISEFPVRGTHRSGSMDLIEVNTGSSIDIPAPPASFSGTTDTKNVPLTLTSDLVDDKISPRAFSITQVSSVSSQGPDYNHGPKLNPDTTWLIDTSSSPTTSADNTNSENIKTYNSPLVDFEYTSANNPPDVIAPEVYSYHPLEEPQSPTQNLYTSQSQSPEYLTPNPEHQDPEDPDMDPSTGLRRTAIVIPLSPMEKAVRFVENTELSYKVKKKEKPGEVSEPLSPEQAQISLELEHGRHEILETMRVRTKRLDSWVAETPETDNNKIKTDSERKYEERKRRLQQDKYRSEGTMSEESLSKSESSFSGSDTWSPPPSFGGNYSLIGYQSPPLSTTDVDSRSIQDQNKTKQHWETKLASGNEKLYPDHQPNSDFNSNKASVDIVVKKSVSFENNNIYDNESAVDREIRLAREREEELRKEQEERKQEQLRRQTDMPIHKVPDPVKVQQGVYADAPILPTTPPPLSTTAYRELPEVDQVLSQESIIEREIREQQQKEESYKYKISVNKEAEQSEFERQEKEHERVQAHESIVDRDIREAQERERELQRLRLLKSGLVEDHSPQVPEVTYTEPSPVTEVPPVVMAAETVYKEPPPPVIEEETPASEPIVAHHEAISLKSRTGESIMERELREQKEREEEFRSHYREMGLENFLATQEPSDTPFNRPEPSQPDIARLPPQAKATIKTRMTKSVSEPVRISSPSPVKPVNHVTPTKVPQSISQDAISKAQPEESRSPKVQQFLAANDDTDGFDESYRFVPQNETPIEREMRLAREREDELRQSRGLPAQSRDPEAIVEIKEFTSPPPKPHVAYKKGDEGDGKFIKKFASTRLQHEIQKEKRREQDLKSKGQISTLSEERTGPQTKYIDVIPKESLTVKSTPNWKVQQPSSPSPSKQSQDHIDASSASSPESTSSGGQSVQNGSTTTHQVVQSEVVSSTASRVVRPEPSVIQRYASHTSQLQSQQIDKYRSRPQASAAELRIESELREMREREEELRREHRFLGGVKSALSPNGDVSPDTFPANGHETASSVNVTHRQVSSSADSSSAAKTTRRKSALAEEWERKFGANA